MNQLLANVDLADYEYVVVIDDDVNLCDYFLDRFLEIVSMRQYSLSQPARTHSSYIDHFFVSQVHGIESRHTNFVEIGPLFCAHSSCFEVLFPLDEEAPMGWGLDFVWPRLLEGTSKNKIDLPECCHADTIDALKIPNQWGSVA
ncbi:hypothetical protein, partial [Synechococcus sp. 1G10]|uniref:hypothetical protein n=1 Tax=Synechococcus sp. 1G10 TaxID=2025605 RepID=UPI001E4441CB